MGQNLKRGQKEGKLCPECAQDREEQKRIYSRFPINKLIWPPYLDKLGTPEELPHMIGGAPFYVDEELYLHHPDTPQGFERSRFCLSSRKSYRYGEDCASEELVRTA